MHIQTIDFQKTQKVAYFLTSIFYFTIVIANKNEIYYIYILLKLRFKNLALIFTT